MATACSSAVHASRHRYNFPGTPPAPNFVSRFWLWQHKEADHRSAMEDHHRKSLTAAPPPPPPRRARHIQSLVTARVILSILATAAGDPALAKSLLARHVRRLSRETSSHVLGKVDGPDAAVVFFDWAESLPGYRHSVYSCNGLLQIFVDAKRHGDGYDFYRERLLGKYDLNAVSYGILTHGFCKAGEFQRALAMLDEMRRSGVRPNVVIHTTIIRGLCNAGKVSQALIHFRRLGEEEGDGDGGGLCVPNVYTYSVLVDALCKAGQPDEAYGLVTEMVRKGCPPNVVTYNALIDGFRKVAKLDEVLMLLREMSLRGCRPDVVTYTMVMDIFCKSDRIDEAYRLLDAVEKKNPVTYNSLLLGLAAGEQDRSGEALDLLEKMIREGIRPNQVNYRTVLQILCKNNRLDEAYQLLLSMHGQGCKADDASFKILIVALAAAGRTYDSLELLGRMLGSGYVLDTKTLNVIIHKFCLAGDLSEAHQLFKSMSQRGSIPSNVTYNTLIGAFSKAAQPDAALMLLEQMIRAGFTANVVVYNSVIRSLCKEQRQEEALRVFQAMVDRGCFPDRTTYRTLRMPEEETEIYERLLRDAWMRRNRIDPAK